MSNWELVHVIKVDEFQIENTFTLYNDWGHHNGFDYGVSFLLLFKDS